MWYDKHNPGDETVGGELYGHALVATRAVRVELVGYLAGVNLGIL